MIDLEKIKQKIIHKHNFIGYEYKKYFLDEEDDSIIDDDFEEDYHDLNYDSKDLFKSFYKMMIKYPAVVKNIEEKVSKGIEFRKYFENNSTLQELLELRTTNTEMFYQILRREELFLNTCLIAFGFNNIIISLDPDHLSDYF